MDNYDEERATLLLTAWHRSAIYRVAEGDDPSKGVITESLDQWCKTVVVDPPRLLELHPTILFSEAFLPKLQRYQDVFSLWWEGISLFILPPLVSRCNLGLS